MEKRRVVPATMARHGERGFSLVELVVSTAIMLVVTAAVFGLVDPAQGVFRTQPEVADMQQRLRVGVDALREDLLMAGAGTYLGGSGGSLLNVVAPIMPIRFGRSGDNASGVYYRADAITVMYVPQTTAQTRVTWQMPATSSEIRVEGIKTGCPGIEACGFRTGMRAFIFDPSGAWDFFTITQVQLSAGHLQHNQDNFSKAYGTDAQVAAVATSTYYLKSDASADTFQLRFSDGDQLDVPLVDNVVDVAFEYFGEPRGPALLKPVRPNDPGPFTTYGPPPPQLGDTRAPWPQSENCAFVHDAASGLQVSRLADLSNGAETLVPLNAASLIDGPWCPNAASALRFDADLLRIRSIGVRLRVQVTSATMRGPAGVLFSRGGTSKSSASFVPDQEVRFDVTPRNLNLRR